ncbi:phosphate acyltransferase PlsX [Natranaerobius thermophilus]|uniref:phosphate acyltransferase PlsX n=1 Tax=Natranaerobius thermophilus TaxID=375929 RepID=UPI00059B7C04
MRVALDAMGGDHAPKAPVKGALLAVQELQEISISLVGQKELIEQELSRIKSEDFDDDNIHIVDAREIISGEDNPTQAIREKKDSSLVKAMNLLKDNQVEAVVSAGNTGAFMAGGLLKLGRLANIKRPALAPVFPAFDGNGTVVLDVGATMDPKPEHLKDFAIMGSVYAEKVLGRERPRVGLINVGEEAGKGNQLTKESYSLLETAPINFCGNVEARELLSGDFDVVVCEGFMGNVLLKFMEGIGKGLFGTMKDEFTADFKSKLGAWMLKPRMKSLKSRFDYNEYGGAPFLGVNGILVKSHGSSNETAIKNAIVRQVYHFVNNEVLTAFSQEIEKGVETDE